MPLIPLLAVAVFAQATSEFMLSGLLPDIAADLSVSVPTAGTLTSAFALGIVVGAPVTAVAGRRRRPRAALTAFLALVVAAHVLGALAPDYPVLLASRVVAAVGNAGFLAVALPAAVRVIGPERTGRATATLLAGTTLACVAGVPAGAVVGQWLGWRAAFWAVALLCLPPLVVIARSGGLGRLPAPGGGVELRSELAVLRGRGPATLLGTGALANGATFCGYTYLAVVVTDVAGLPDGWVPGALALFGAGSFVGVTAGGRWADRTRWTRPVVVCGVAAVAGWCAAAAFARQPVVLLAAAPVLGALSFAVGSSLFARVLVSAADARTLGGAAATASFNVGAIAGPLLGGAVIGLTDPRGAFWVAAALVTAAGAAALVPRVLGSADSGRALPSAR